MIFSKPKNVTYQQISETSGVSLRTVKRYASGANVTTENAKSIMDALSTLSNTKSSPQQGGIIPETQTEFFFQKAMFKHHLFWSSPIDKTRNIDGVIETYVKTPNLQDIYVLVRLFGAKRVLGVAKRVYIAILREFGMRASRLGTLSEYQVIIRMVNYSLGVKQ